VGNRGINMSLNGQDSSTIENDITIEHDSIRTVLRFQNNRKPLNDHD